MKVQIMSDLHLESCPQYVPQISLDEDVCTLILAGDICEVDKESTLMKFLTDMSKRFQYVIYVAGNHEYYNGHLDKTRTKLKKIVSQFNNVYLLDNSVIELDGIKFIGCTLWTDINKCNPIDIINVQYGLNDYRKIRVGDGYRKITCAETVSLHKNSLIFLEENLKNINCDKTIVVTHHAPSYLSIVPKYHGDPCNPAYASELTPLIERFNPKIWVHGHMHNNLDYTYNNTRIICNPKGYSFIKNGYIKNENAGFSEDYVIEI